jgi:uncharacterized membrane protein (DUF441 family)
LKETGGINKMSKSPILKLMGIIILAALVLLPVISGPALAQEFRGTIAGRATDATGAVMPGVAVSITNVETGLTIKLTTNESGQYAAPLLQVGNWAK